MFNFRNLIRISIVLGAALLTLILTGCVGSLPFQWKFPALDLLHFNSDNYSGPPYDDSQADLVHYNNRSYIVFKGTLGSPLTTSIFLADADLFASKAINPMRDVTFPNNPWEDKREDDPHIVAAGGYLYIVYTRWDEDNYNIYWLKRNASTLAAVAGPITVSNLAGQVSLPGFNDVGAQAVYLPASGRTAIVWAGTNNVGNPVIWYNYVTDAGATGAPVRVSEGTNCPGDNGNYPQTQPQIARSSPNGNYVFVSWVGQDSANSYYDVYWTL